MCDCKRCGMPMEPGLKVFCVPCITEVCDEFVGQGLLSSAIEPNGETSYYCTEEQAAFVAEAGGIDALMRSRSAPPREEADHDR